MGIEQEAAERIKYMCRGNRRWFASDFDADSDLDEASILDYVTTAPDWVCGEAELTPLGREVWRQIKARGKEWI